MKPNVPRLDSLNEQLGVKTPAQIFTKCPRCKRDDLLEFEGEVFCNHCPWDSVLMNAEVLALALHRFDQRTERRGRKPKPRVTAISSPYLHLFFPSERPKAESASPQGEHPDVA